MGRVVINLDEPDKMEGTPDDLVLHDGDTLKVPQIPSTVVVMGSVRNPTGIVHKKNMDVQYYLNRAGGVSPDGAVKETYILKVDGSAITSFTKLRHIDPGDVIIVPTSSKDKINKPALIRDVVTIAGQVGIGLAALAAIF